jgi:membrane protein implicated in regulation of membrane protease activity
MRNFYISFGLWIIVIPYLGIPGTWKSALILLSGLFLILISIGPIVLKKLQTKPKPKKKQNKAINETLTTEKTEPKISDSGAGQIENNNEN